MLPLCTASASLPIVFCRTLSRSCLPENGERSEERQAGVDQRRQLPGEDHEHPRLDCLALEEDDLLAAYAARRAAAARRLWRGARPVRRAGPPLPSSETLVGK